MGCIPEEQYQDQFIEVLNQYSQIIKIWSDIKNYYDVIYANLLFIYDLSIHYHKTHLHPFNHDAEERPDEVGSLSRCPKLNPISRLLREIQTQFDRDDNALKYGDDFIFPEDDPDLPRSIISTQIQFEIQFGRLEDNLKSVADFIKSFGVQQRCGQSGSADPIHNALLQLVLGKNPNSPKSNEVYGKDYIIDPEDTRKPQLIAELEKTMPLPEDIKKIPYDEYLKNYVNPPSKSESVLQTDNKPSKLSEIEKRISLTCNYISTRLVAEWLHQVDIDHNGLIYGVDFMFSDDNPQKSRCLKELEQDLDWNVEDDIPIMTWEQFCLTFPDGNPDDRYKK